MERPDKSEIPVLKSQANVINALWMKILELGNMAVVCYWKHVYESDAV